MFKMRRKPERFRPRTQGYRKSAGRNIRAACRQGSSAAAATLIRLPTGNSINMLYRGPEGPYFPEFVFSISSMKEVRYRRNLAVGTCSREGPDSTILRRLASDLEMAALGSRAGIRDCPAAVRLARGGPQPSRSRGRPQSGQVNHGDEKENLPSLSRQRQNCRNRMPFSTRDGPGQGGRCGWLQILCR